VPHRWQYQGGVGFDGFVDGFMAAISQMKTRRAWPRRLSVSG
jgi:hypothetical protein